MLLIFSYRVAMAELLAGWARSTWAGDVQRASTIREATRRLKAASLLIAEIGSPETPVFELVKAGSQRKEPLPSILLAERAALGWVRRALESGASSYLSRSAPLSELARAIEAVVQGQRAFSPAVASIVADLARGGPGLATFTPREVAVLQEICRGLSTKEIAQRLGLQPKTIEFARSRLMQKTGTMRAADLVRYACEEGFVDLVPRREMAAEPVVPAPRSRGSETPSSRLVK